MSNQSGTESPQPSKGHTPDGSNGASQLGQGRSEADMEAWEELSEDEKEVFRKPLYWYELSKKLKGETP